MLGNFPSLIISDETIVWAWKLLTDVLKIDKMKLWVTVYLEDDKLRIFGIQGRNTMEK